MSARDRLDECARAWRVSVDHVRETEASLLAFGRRGGQPVVLKVVRQPGEEWTSGRALHAFGGRGVVRVFEYTDGAFLLEALRPGHSLVSMTLEGRDDEATDVIAGLIQQMSDAKPPRECATLDDWGRAFDRYAASGHRAIPHALVEEGHGWFAALASSQRRPRLLHGDLHHDNVLFDANRGWLAIDPKGVVGETEYEIGAMLRNPHERPDAFLSTAAVDRRIARFSRSLNVDVRRALAWGFAQAVLSAIWSIEDGFWIDDRSPAVRLANIIREMVPSLP